MAQERETSAQEKAEEKPTAAVEGSAEQSTGTLAATPSGEGALTQSDEFTSPFVAMRRMMENVDRLLSGFGFGLPSLFTAPATAMPLGMIGGGPWVPAIEAFEREGKLVLSTDLPGLRREDVHVEVAGDELIVSGERKQEEKRTAGGRAYSERRYGSFERRITLPKGVDPKSIEASFDNGVLEISLAVPGQESRKIEVKSGTKKKEKGEGGEVH
ncbi:MAG TPA: Hsp20/alpha crystallin family protein [Labilithrix sp.]|nr:Hsp20/alpha crystallin family protein [Labilithrix sp.]